MQWMYATLIELDTADAKASSKDVSEDRNSLKEDKNSGCKVDTKDIQDEKDSRGGRIDSLEKEVLAEMKMDGDHTSTSGTTHHHIPYTIDYVDDNDRVITLDTLNRNGKISGIPRVLIRFRVPEN